MGGEGKGENKRGGREGRRNGRDGGEKIRKEERGRGFRQVFRELEAIGRSTPAIEVERYE